MIRKKSKVKKVKKVKVVKTKKPKKIHLYDGIKFRSGLELNAYKLLQEAGIKFEYEKTTYVLQDSFINTNASYEKVGKNPNLVYKETSKIQKLTYTPDFEGEKFFVETKGFLRDSATLKYKLFKKYLLDNGIKKVFLMPRNIKDIKECIEIIKSL